MQPKQRVPLDGSPQLRPLRRPSHVLDDVARCCFNVADRLARVGCVLEVRNQYDTPHSVALDESPYSERSGRNFWFGGAVF